MRNQRDQVEEEEKKTPVKEIELVEMTSSKDTIGCGTSSELPLDTKLLTQHEKGTSILSFEEEEDQELRLYIHELTNYLVDEVCKRAELSSSPTTNTIRAIRNSLAPSD